MMDIEVRGDTAEMFALMLHDRIVDLERQLAELRPPSVDERITVLGPATTNTSRNVYVCVRRQHDTDADAWAADVCRRLGERWACDVDVACCSHFSIDQTFVLEALVCLERDTQVADVAHAVLAATLHAGEHDVHGDRDDVHGDRRPAVTSVLASAVRSPDWFAESIARAAGREARAWRWDAASRAVEADPPPAIEQSDGWCMLEGWLATHRERVDVQHPRALSAHAESRRLWALVTRLA
jgi:hypothetical protein